MTYFPNWELTIGVWGIMVSLIFLLVVTLLVLSVKGFNIWTEPLSELGALKKTHKEFNTLLAAYGVCLIPFLYVVGIKFKLYNQPLILTLLLTSSVVSAPAAKFHSSNKVNVHTVLGGLGFAAACLGSLLFSAYVFTQYPVLGVFQGVLTVVVVTIMIMGVLKHHSKIPAIYEYAFFGGVVVWNIANSIPFLLN